MTTSHSTHESATPTATPSTPLEGLCTEADRLIARAIDHGQWAMIEAAAPRAWRAGTLLIAAGKREDVVVVLPLGYVLALKAIIAAGVDDYAPEAMRLHAALVATDPTLDLVL